MDLLNIVHIITRSVTVLAHFASAGIIFYDSLQGRVKWQYTWPAILMFVDLGIFYAASILVPDSQLVEVWGVAIRLHSGGTLLTYVLLWHLHVLR